MKKTNPLLASLLVLLIVSFAVADETIKLKVKAGDHTRTKTLVSTLIDAGDAKSATVMVPGSRQASPAQLAEPGLLAQNSGEDIKGKKELLFTIPYIEKGKEVEVTVNLSDDPVTGRTFVFNDEPGVSREMSCADCHIQGQDKTRPMFKYMYKKLDPADREGTYKVFHHVYKPGSKEVLTKGPGGKFPHHRGIFYGFNKSNYIDKDGNKQSCDTWHSRGAHQAHDEFINEDIGKVIGRHIVGVDWVAEKGGDYTFAKERRQLAAWKVEPSNGGNGTFIEFVSELSPVKGNINLGGDPQHAGFQFRAHNDVSSKNAKETYYIRPNDGVGEKGETRNWPGNKDQIDLPWKGMSFMLEGKRYTVAYLDNPKNPKPAMFSERDYGRFGSFFVTEVKEDEPLVVNYRVWVQEGEMTPEEIEALSNDFVDPVEVEVVK